jgi:hypothetical protein
MKNINRGKTIIFISVFALASSAVIAQPSGGPYGPVARKYELPETIGKIYYVAANGKNEASGEELAQPTSLESAIGRVKTGDAIVLRGGVYRTGNLLLNQGVTIQPYADEHPIIKGTFIAAEWSNLGNGLWKTSWPRLFPAKPLGWWRRDWFGRQTPLHRFNNDMVFIDGEFLQSVGELQEVNEKTYYIDYDAKQVYIGTDPSNRLVEITAFDIAIRRLDGECHGKKSDGKGPVLRGITFTQYAQQALEVEGTEPEGISQESQHGKRVVGTTLEDCTISYCSRVAAYLRGDKLTVRNCRVSDTSTEGLYIIASSDVLLEKNIFSRNNIEKITGYYPAAVKIFNQCHRVTCRDNLVTDLPYSNGIWYDVGNVDGIFINNRVEGVGYIKREVKEDRPWPSENGFFFEISRNAVCAGNVFVNCDHGIFILNSSNVLICQNTLVNSEVCIGRNARSPATDGTFGWHSGTGPAVEKREGHVFINNLLVGDKDYDRYLFFVWQPDSLCKQLVKPMLKHSDGNLFVRHPADIGRPIILWSSTSPDRCEQVELNTVQEFNKLYPEFAVSSRLSWLEIPSIFKDPGHGDYALLKTFRSPVKSAPLPPDAAKLLQMKNEKGRIGAYGSR